jgi:hypothetical protein
MSVAQLRHWILSAAVLAPLCALPSCLAPQFELGADNENLNVGRLRSVWPVEVVVPPIKNTSGVSDVPVDELRRQFRRGLVQRFYTPLAQEFVDGSASATEASYGAGSLGEQAVLDVTVTGWNTTRWRSHATLTVDVDILLLDATDPDPAKALWGGHATRVVDLSRERNSFIDEAKLMQRAVEVTVDGIMTSLPQRESR